MEKLTRAFLIVMVSLLLWSLIYFFSFFSRCCWIDGRRYSKWPYNMQSENSLDWASTPSLLKFVLNCFLLAYALELGI